MGNSLGRAPLGGSDVLRSRAVGTGFQDKFHQCDCPEKLCAQGFFKWFVNVGRWDMHSFVGRGQHSKCTAVGTGFSGQISSIRLFRKTVHPRAAKVCKPWAMGHALLRWQGARLKEKSCWHGFFRTNSINAIVPKNRCQRLVKRCLNARQRDMPDMHGKKHFAGGIFILLGVLSVDAWLCSEAN